MLLLSIYIYKAAHVLGVRHMPRPIAQGYQSRRSPDFCLTPSTSSRSTGPLAIPSDQISTLSAKHYLHQCYNSVYSHYHHLSLALSWRAQVKVNLTRRVMAVAEPVQLGEPVQPEEPVQPGEPVPVRSGEAVEAPPRMPARPLAQ